MLKSAGSLLSARAALSPKMAPTFANGVDSRRSMTYTPTALKRWSCQSNGDLPAIPDIKAIHVYDFDNTLFSSPLPNPQLWSGSTAGFLQSYDCFSNGGWWHDPNILSSTGQGLEIEERQGWKGWWNEHIVQLVQLSMEQKDALTVLLTGRAEGAFADLIKRIINSRPLEFDLVCLKPEVGPNSQRFKTTMNFKQTFLEDLVLTYKQADEIRIYEDRAKHVKGFRDFLEQLNLSFSAQASTRKPLGTTEVIHVAEETKYLPPVAEAAEVQRMINAHNENLATTRRNLTNSPYGRLRLKRTTFFTGYFLSNADSSRLIQYILNPQLPSGLAESGDLKILSNNILITVNSASRSLLSKVGGIGNVVRWRVTGTAVFENKLWAARVAPMSDNEVIHTANPEPMVILALRKGTRAAEASRIRKWHPVADDDALVFDTSVGEKMVLQVELEEREFESSYGGNKGPNKRGPRYEMLNDDIPPTAQRDHRPPVRGRHVGPPEYSSGPKQNQHPYHGEGSSRRGSGPQHGYRGRGRGGGRGGRGGGRGRGRGGPPGGYRSLDDYGAGPSAHDGPPDDRGGPTGAGEPVMNY